MKDYGLGLVIVLVVAVVMVGAVWEFDASYQQLRSSWVQQAIAQSQADTARYIVDQVLATEHDKALAPVKIALSITLLAVVGGLAVFLLLAGIDQYRLRRIPLVRFDSAGLLSVSRAGLEAGLYDGLIAQLATGAMQARLAAASTPALPEHLVYSPHLSNRETALPALPTGIEPIALPTAPSWADLTAGGFVPSVDHLLLGFGLSGPVYVSLEQTLSVLVAGRPGQGKTTLLRSLYLQTRMVGARAIAWDLHGSLTKDLPGCEAYTTPTEIDASASAIIPELERRIAGRLYHEQPVMVMVDEVPIVSEATDNALPAIRRLVLEGRKYQMFCSVSGQGVPSKLFEKAGGSLVRDAFSLRAVFWTSALQGRMAGLENQDAKMLDSLQPGRCIMAGPIRPTVIAVPDCTAGDLTSIAGLPGGLQGTSSGTSEGGRSSSDAENVLPGRSSSGVEERIFQLLEEGGRTKGQIIKEVFGVTGGRAYQEAAAQVDAVREKYLAQRGTQHETPS